MITEDAKQINTTLYSLNKNGSFNEWKVFVDEEKVIVEFGLHNGKMQTKETICKPTNEGRSNERDAKAQALFEADAKWKDQVRTGYKETMDEEVVISPMLAKDASKNNKLIKYPCHIMPKLDGCFTSNTLVQTSSGLLKIGDIVENKIRTKVLSYNEEKDRLEYKPIVGWFNNGMKPATEWRKFGRTGITRNHELLTRNGWAPYENVEEVFTTNNRYLGIICGMLLGDSVAVIDKRGGEESLPSWRLNFSVGKKDIEYGESKAALLSGTKYHIKEYTSGYGTPCISFVSSSMTKSIFPISVFYEVDKSNPGYGKRVIDIDYYTLADIFTDESLAIWYFDDGSLHYNNGNSLTPRIFISVPRYSEKTIENFVRIFNEKYNVEAHIGYYGKETRLSFSTKDSLLLLWRIALSMGKLLPRKIPEGYSLGEYQPQDAMGYCKIDKSLNNFGSPHGCVAYDIEVADNHNYFANNTLVHNCRTLVTFDNKGEPILNSRGNKVYPCHDLLKNDLMVLHEASGYPMFDGELYIHGLSLQKIVSLAKKLRTHEQIEAEIKKDYDNEVKRRLKAIQERKSSYKTTAGDEVSITVVPELDINRYGGYCSTDLQLNIFDIPSNSKWGDLSYNDRYSDLKDVDYVISKEELSSLKIVHPRLVHEEDEVITSIGTFMQQGYEGTIIRNLNGLYEFNQRSSDLLKWKIFKNEEVKVISVEEDKNNEGILLCIRKSGVKFNCKMKGTHQERSVASMQKLIDKFITIKYQADTEDGAPQFPVGICIREVDPDTWEPLE